jgi:hypothetical protein
LQDPPCLHSLTVLQQLLLLTLQLRAAAALPALLLQ